MIQISTIVYIIGLCGIFLNRKNLLIILMSIELMLLAINLNFISSSSYLDDISGYVFALFILTIAAAESAIGLAILVVYYRVTQSIHIDTIHLLRG